MTFPELLEQVRELLRSKGRVSYRALKLQFDLTDDYLEGLKDELIEAERVAADENGKVLVWIGSTEEDKGKGIKEKGINGKLEGETAKGGNGEKEFPSSQPLAPSPHHPGERRQLTVMFCDLVGSTALSAQLDPEDYQSVVQRYQQICTPVIQQHDGYIAQHLGDGLLVYFGYPRAHEDDARRAVRAGLEIVVAIQKKDSLPPIPLPQGLDRLQVRIGIHTGPVVMSEIGSSEKRELLALGETPNIAARVQGAAEPNTVVLSATTQHLVSGLFECQELGPHTLKGITIPLALFRVLRETEAHSRFEVALRTGLTPLVGRDEELALLQRRWQQAKEGEGQIVLLSGEAGIGKSRLVQELKDAVTREGAVRIEFRCSPYHQNSAFYPILDHLQRLLQFVPEDTPQTKLHKLQQALGQYRFPQAETLLLLASLLSLPQPDGVAPLTWSPQKQKEKTQETLVAWMVEEAARQAVYLVWEDLHWLDPSSLEVLTLILQQVVTSRALVVLTYRPDFTPTWRPREHTTQLTLNRLGQQQVAAMINQVTAKALLSAEVVQQIISRTDEVPLFVEELTKSVVESVGATHASPLQLAIPATLHDSLMARLDRLGTAKAVAQLGATLGREFSYELLQAVSPVDALALQHTLQQLVDAELLYQRGLPPQATYLFKHALIQDAAYQSLLKSTRQQYHRQIAQVLEEQFAETRETQPEMLAHHYTEAGLNEHAIPYWQKAGERANERSAYVEAIRHVTKAVELLTALPKSTERIEQELTLQITLGTILAVTRGYTAPEVEQAYARALELCQQIGEPTQLFPLLLGLWGFHIQRVEHDVSRELGTRLLRLAQETRSPNFCAQAHYSLGSTLFYAGDFVEARGHLQQGVHLSDPHGDSSDALLRLRGQDAKVTCLAFSALVLWVLGYPDQALMRGREALARARQLANPFRLAWTLNFTTMLYQYRRESQDVHAQANALMTLSTEQGFPYWLALGTVWQGWALAGDGQVKEGIARIQQGTSTFRATGAELAWSYWLALLGETQLKGGQVEDGLTSIAKALVFVDRTGERLHETELYRLKGQLTLQQQSKVQSLKSKDTEPQPLNPDPHGEAEACFLQAIAIARKQQAKSLELRATMSLVRLRQQQAAQHESRITNHVSRTKLAEAHRMLSELYNWFTEGFDTKDLQEAKALLEELSH
ncbi:MAG: adenylate/guanylate cyclase domain-containing protein [Candidatus Binatia bacterium]